MSKKNIGILLNTSRDQLTAADLATIVAYLERVYVQDLKLSQQYPDRFNPEYIAGLLNEYRAEIDARREKLEQDAEQHLNAIADHREQIEALSRDHSRGMIPAAEYADRIADHARSIRAESRSYHKALQESYKYIRDIDIKHDIHNI